MRPSELPEDHAILAINNHGAGIGFHRYYGELSIYAVPTNGDPRKASGIHIPCTEEQADALYETIQNRTNSDKTVQGQNGWNTQHEIHYLRPTDPTPAWPEPVISNSDRE